MPLPHLDYSLRVLQLIDHFQHRVLKRVCLFKHHIVLLSQQIDYLLNVPVLSVTFLHPQFGDTHKRLLHDIKYPLISDARLAHVVHIHRPFRSTDHTEQAQKRVKKQEERRDSNDDNSEVSLHNDAISPAYWLHIGKEDSN